jgi:hypothetical protein
MPPEHFDFWRGNFNVRIMSLLLFHPLFCHKFSIEKRKFLHCHWSILQKGTLTWVNTVKVSWEIFLVKIDS